MRVARRVAEVASPATIPTPGPTDHPGRWLGGLIGAIVSLLIAACGLFVSTGLGLAIGEGLAAIDADGFVALGLAGMPIGFIVGRTFLPDARNGTWRHASAIGLGVGLIAPPLGALEILIGYAMTTEAQPAGLGGFDPLTFAVVFGPVAIAVSYVVTVATIPAGIVWALLVHAVPERALLAARMPRPISRLGLRHGAVVIVVWLAIATIIRTTGT